MKCLAKRPADRWQTADELLAQLEPLATPSGGTTPTTTRPMKSVSTSATASGPRRWLVAAALLVALAGSLLFAFSHRSREIRLGRRLQLTLAAGLELDPALSPDGKLVAFVTGPLARTRLYVRQVEGGGSPVAITPEGQGYARVPRWSPDGERLVFSSDRGIEVMPALGGSPRLLVRLTAGRLARRELVARRKVDRVRLGRLGTDASSRWDDEPGTGPAGRGPLVQLVAGRTLDRLRLG